MSLLPRHIRFIDLTLGDFEDYFAEKLISIQNQISNKTLAPITQKVDLNTLCQIYKWPKNTIYSWVSKNYIPYAKVGRKLIFDLKDIEKFIDENKIMTNKQIKDSLKKFRINYKTVSKI